MDAARTRPVWRRPGACAGASWVLVDEPSAGDPHDDPALSIDRGTGATSHRSRRRRPSARRRTRADRPSWLWTIRWYRARWSARRALRSR